MRVLMINGSLRRDTSSEEVCELIEKVLKEENIEWEYVRFFDVQGCIACGKCIRQKKCIYDDVVNETSVKAEGCDAVIVVGSAVYGELNTSLVGYLDRLFRSASIKFANLPALCYVISKKDDSVSAVQKLKEYFSLGNMFVVTHQKGNVICTWNGERMQDVTDSVHNLIYLMKCLSYGREKGEEPKGKPESIRDFTR